MIRPAAVLGCGLAWLPAPALAHDAIAGAGGFLGGVLHPFVVPAHVLVLLALALWLAQQGQARVEAVLPGFALLLAAGLALSALQPPPALLLVALLVLAIVIGVLVAAAWPLPGLAGGALAAVAALLIGLDSATEPDAFATMAADLAWVAVGVHLLLLNLIALASLARRPWLAIGRRVLGSWTAASALMVLALQIVR